MGISIPAAIVATGAISAGASLASSSEQASAAESAAGTQAGAEQAALAEQTNLLQNTGIPSVQGYYGTAINNVNTDIYDAEGTAYNDLGAGWNTINNENIQGQGALSNAGSLVSAALQPEVNLGLEGGNLEASLLGLGGGNPATEAAALAQTPGFQFANQQGLLATQNSNAAKGLGNSGAALEGAANYSEGLASTQYQNLVADAQNIFSTGTGAATSLASNQSLLGQAGASLASNIGSLGVNLASNNANTIANLAENQANTQGGLAENASGNTTALLDALSGATGQAITGQANALAAGTVGSATAIGNGLTGLASSGQNAASNYLLYNYLTGSGGDGLFGGAGTVD